MTDFMIDFMCSHRQDQENLGFKRAASTWMSRVDSTFRMLTCWQRVPVRVVPRTKNKNKNKYWTRQPKKVLFLGCLWWGVLTICVDDKKIYSGFLFFRWTTTKRAGWRWTREKINKTTETDAGYGHGNGYLFFFWVFVKESIGKKNILWVPLFRIRQWTWGSWIGERVGGKWAETKVHQTIRQDGPEARSGEDFIYGRRNRFFLCGGKPRAGYSGNSSKERWGGNWVQVREM